MPLSEFYQASIRGKHDSTQSKMANCSSNLSSFMSDNEFVELIWENGQIVMQSKSNRPRKTSIATTNLSSPDERVERKDSTAISMTKMGRLETMNSFASDFSPSDPSSNVRMSAQFDSMVPWINYPIEEPAPNDYCSDFFSEFPGVIMPANGNNSAGHNIKDSPNVANGLVSKALTDESDLSTLRTMHQSSQSYQSSFPSNTSRTEDLGTRAGNNAQQGTSGDLLGTRLQKQDIATSRPHQMGISMDSINFSHFSRLGVLAKANLQSVDIDRLRSNQNSPTAASSNRIESTAIQSSCGLQSTSGIQGQLSSVSAMSELGSSMKTSQEFVSVEQLEAVYDEDVPRKNHNDDITKINLRSPDQMNHQSSDLAAGISLGRSGIEKDREAIVSSSSVCSGNTAGAISDDPKQSAKRKNQEEEESDNHIEDLEDASVGIKKPAAVKGMSAKRSRAAEVHNLSERRRRDRINEKMRALQELIPNCSKVDKASMLDEAIEYLKTLQLQVQFLTQMMSMGTGLRVPPMMLPNGMQHMRVPPVPQFSQIGVGMGMNMRFGYGMGMLDMNGSPGCPLIPAPPMHGTPFPCSAVPGLQSLYAMPRSTNLPTFGLPAPGLPTSVPRVPPFTFMSGLSANLNSMPGASTTATTTLQAPDAAPSASSKDQQENSLNLELLQKTNANDSQGIKESSQQCMSNQTSSASENETVN